MLTSLAKIHPSLPLATMRAAVAVDTALGISQRLGVGWTFAVRGCVGYVRCACALAWVSAVRADAPSASAASARRAGVLAMLVGWALFDAGLAWLLNVLAAQTVAGLGAALVLLIQRRRAASK